MSYLNTLSARLLRRCWPSASLGVEERTRRRVAVHLIPYLFCLYVLAYIDRVNVSVAQLGMTKSPQEGGLGFTSTVIGIGFGLFFWGYLVLEIPSTLSVLRWGARWVFVRILILWGLCCTLIGFIGLDWFNGLSGWLMSPAADACFQAIAWVAGTVFQVPVNGELDGLVARQFCLFRFLLGFFESGFFPSAILYLSFWFRAEDRARAVASFMAAIPISYLIGLPISALLLNVSWAGLPGWRWIFIVQGLAPMAAGIITFFYLPDRPEQARWLSPEEKTWLNGELSHEAVRKKRGEHGHWRGLGFTVLLLTACYFCINLIGYGLPAFMPKIIQTQLHLSDTYSSLVATLPFVMGLVGMLLNGWHSDKTGERIGHAVVVLTALGIGIFLAGLFEGYGLLTVLILIFLVGSFMYAHHPAFWPIPSMILGGSAAASAIGFINMLGNFGGFVGPALMGSYLDQNQRAEGLRFLAIFPFTAAFIILGVGVVRRTSSPPTTQARP
jgi:sugar phosphate permease